ncbi:hypothetical protein [Nonomuraea sp. NPDC049646]|uniref:hypothetical protein n=1 Tax=unclassified Nonomuraea TaxID=2593643 RepID=UPI00378EF4D5
MALEWYLRVGETEIANTARLAAYLDSVGSPLTSVDAAGCGCPTLTAELLGDLPYTSPQEDRAPWWDPDVPESAEFAGVMILSVAGVNRHPVTRAVTGAVAGGAALGPARVQPLTMVFTALLLGSSCCGVEYGARWLAAALEGCTGQACGGDCVTLYNCCPAEDLDPEVFAERHRRTLRRVALTDGPTEIARAGDGCAAGGACEAAGADIVTVEWTLVAATPWQWTDPVPILQAPLPADTGEECVTWCVHGGPGQPVAEMVCFDLTEDACSPGAAAVEFTATSCAGPGWPALDQVPVDPCEAACRLAACPGEESLCADPSCRTPTPPQPSPPETCYCAALAVNTACYDLDLSGRAGWFADAPMITVSAGSSELRRLTITFYERTDEHDGLTCEEIAELERCNPHSVYHVSYVPAGGVLTLDGQVGRAMVECGGVCETSSDVFGRDGSPPSWALLDCDRYCVCIDSDALVPPAADATIEIAVSGRGY